MFFFIFISISKQYCKPELHLKSINIIFKRITFYVQIITQSKSMNLNQAHFNSKVLEVQYYMLRGNIILMFHLQQDVLYRVKRTRSCRDFWMNNCCQISFFSALYSWEVGLNKLLTSAPNDTFLLTLTWFGCRSGQSVFSVAVHDPSDFAGVLAVALIYRNANEVHSSAYSIFLKSLRCVCVWCVRVGALFCLCVLSL